MIVKVYLPCCGGDKVIENVNEAIRLSGVDAQVEATEDMIELVKAGIMSTPAIKIDNRLISSGRMPKTKDLAALLTDAASKES